MVLPEKNRLEAFSDGVFAILITLLVLEIRVPHFEDLSPVGILNGLSEVGSKFIAFIISFIIIAIYWISHHAMFNQIKYVTGKILWVNIIAILAICIVPFTTAMLGDYPFTSMTVFLYAFNILIVGILFFFLEYSIVSSIELIDPRNTTSNIKRNSIGTLLNIAACVMAFIWIPATYLILIISRLTFIGSQLNIKKK